MNVERRRHNLSIEFNGMNTRRSDGERRLPRIFGDWQYIYTGKKGQISLVELIDYYGDGIDRWEIYSLQGELFDDVERFKSKEEAERRIKELLGEEVQNYGE